jgi:arylsulfatase A-like enzyme
MIGKPKDIGLPPSHPTLPSLLRKAGYNTTLVGKWHLGFLPAFEPLKSGYDHFFGIYGCCVDYFNHGPDASSKEPFLLSLHFTAPHWLWEGPDDEAESKRLRDIRNNRDSGTQATYAKMGQSLDANIGRVGAKRALELGANHV